MLTYEEMAIEYMKSYEDKSRIYFIEHYLSTFNADIRKTTPFLLFPRQKVFLNTVAEKPNTIAIKHRQCGITTVSSAWIAGQFVFCDSDSKETVLAVANKLDLSVQIIDKIRDFLLQVPRWFWGDDFYSPDPKSEKNKRDIFVKNSKQELELFNGCKAFARSSGENAARGISAASILIFDEAAFIENGVSVYSSAVAASASVKDAKIIMVSTPNGKDQLYYQTYRKSILGENNFTPVEFKWYQDMRYNRFLRWYKKDENGKLQWDIDETIDEDGHIIYNEERWKELSQKGWTPTSPWYEEMCKSFNNDSIRIAQEINVSFMGSSNNVVQPEIIEMHSKINVREPLEDFKDPFIEDTWFWKKPIEGHRYLISVDPSSGSADDRTAIQIIDMDGKDENEMPIIEQVGEYNGKQYGDVIGEMVFQYAKLYNNAFVVIEDIGGYGSSAILTLMNLGYTNLYYDDPMLNKYVSKFAMSRFNTNNEAERLPGFRNNSVRFQMLSGFAIMLRNNEFKIRSKRVIAELETWIFKGDSGRMDHMDSSHDDLITCLAMGLFVMKYSFNRIEATKAKDAAILKSFIVTNNSLNQYKKSNYENSISSLPKNKIPFAPIYTERSLKKANVKGSLLWLLSNVK